MAFTDSSGMIKVAQIHQSLLTSLWQSWQEQNFILKLLLLGLVLFYSVVCLFFIVFFYVASVIDFVPYVISKIANALTSPADDLSSKKNFGFFSVIFLPLVVFFLGILTLFIVILPKAFRIGDE